MDKQAVVDTLGCLAQVTRLEAFRLLAAAEPDGLAAGELARRLGVPHNTMSSHLALLTRAELIRGERKSRNIIYRASLPALIQALTYLLKDCCGGRPEICAPLIADLLPSCTSLEECHG